MELAILDFLQAHRTWFLDVMMPVISDMLVVWPLLAFFLLPFKKSRKTGLVMLLAMGLEALICSLLLKNVFQRVRPCDVNTAVQLLIPRPTDYSFPSGHTALSFAALTVLWKNKDLSFLHVPALLMASLIAFSRLYLYVHYPTDILGGILGGIFCGYLALFLAKKVTGPAPALEARS